MLACAALVRLAFVPAASHYEISAYASVPLEFWVLAFGGLSIGCFALLANASTEKIPHVSRIAFIGVMTSNAVLMLVPIFKGYYIFGRGDVLFHYGEIGAISASGHLPSDLFYPLDHINVTIISSITGISVGALSAIWPLVTVMLYMAGFALLTREIVNRDTDRMIVLAFLGALPFGVGGIFMLAPSIQAFDLMPLIVFLFLRSALSPSKVRFSVFLVVMISAAVLYHPLDAILLALIFALTAPILRLARSSGGKERNVHKDELDHTRGFMFPIATSITILLVILLGWNLSFSKTGNFIASLIADLSGNPSLSPAQFYAESLSQTHMDPFHLAIFGLGEYGGYAVLVILGAYVSYKILSDRNSDGSGARVGAYKFILAGHWTLLILTLLGFVITLLVGIRYVKDFVFFATFLVGIGLAGLAVKNQGHLRKSILVITASAILLLICISTVQLYSAPTLTFYPNSQLTEMEFDGGGWFLEKRDANLPTGNLVFDIQQMPNPPNTTKLSIRTAQVPNHFSYDNRVQLGDYYSSATYLLITELGRDWYPEARPGLESHWLWTPEDFSNLEMDSSVVRIFSDGGFDAYLVK